MFRSVRRALPIISSQLKNAVKTSQKHSRLAQVFLTVGGTAVVAKEINDEYQFCKLNKSDSLDQVYNTLQYVLPKDRFKILLNMDKYDVDLREKNGRLRSLFKGYWTGHALLKIVKMLPQSDRLSFLTYLGVSFVKPFIEKEDFKKLLTLLPADVRVEYSRLHLVCEPEIRFQQFDFLEILSESQRVQLINELGENYFKNNLSRIGCLIQTMGDQRNYRFGINKFEDLISTMNTYKHDCIARLECFEFLERVGKNAADYLVLNYDNLKKLLNYNSYYGSCSKPITDIFTIGHVIKLIDGDIKKLNALLDSQTKEHCRKFMADVGEGYVNSILAKADLEKDKNSKETLHKYFTDFQWHKAYEKDKENAEKSYGKKKL